MFRYRLTAVARVALAVTGALIAGVLVLTALAYLILSSRLAAERDRTLLREAEAYTAAITDTQTALPADLTGASRAYLARRTSGAPDTPILLVRLSSGKVLTNTNSRLENAADNRRNLLPATADRGFDTVHLAGVAYRVVTVPVFAPGGEVSAVFQAALAERVTGSVAADLAATLLVAGLGVVLVGAALSAMVARGALRPLSRMADVAEDITQSSLSGRVHWEGPRDDMGRLAESLDRMLDRLESAFAEQRRFVADASHELRTPLTIVRGHLDVMARDGEITQDQQETLALVDDELRRMSRLVTDLLALARLDAATPRRLDRVSASCVTAEAAERASGLGERSFSIDCDEGDGLAVIGDRDLLLQAMLNLLANAVAHTEPGGAIRIVCSKRAGRVLLQVSDTGPGIAADELPRVFDRFYRGAGRRAGAGGAGLGLAIVKRLVELHGGEIRAENVPEGGALFTIDLPAADG